MLPSNLKVLFVGSFTGITGTGEQPDQIHMSRCLSQAGVNVTNLDQAEWHAYVNGKKQDNVPPEDTYDVIILCKWGHYTQAMIKSLKERYKGKLVYWTWDFMFATHREMWTPDWHKMLLSECDIYVSGELGMSSWFKQQGVNFQYFNWDSSDGQYDQLPRDEKYDVVFTGSYIPHSYRNEYLKKVHERFDLTIFSHDHAKWTEQGFKALPGKYDADFNQISSMAKIMLCMNWPEPSLETTGYQSNRIGKILTTGGLPFVHYFPMAERMLGDRVPIFYKEEDLLENIKWFLDNPTQRETARVAAYDFGRANYTTQRRMKEFKILLENICRSTQS